MKGKNKRGIVEVELILALCTVLLITATGVSLFKDISFTGFAALGEDSQQGIQEAIVNSTVVLNSTFGTNSTSENLTVYYTLNDTNAKGIINWYRNGTSIAVLNMPFEGGSNSTFTRDYTPFENNGTMSKTYHVVDEFTSSESWSEVICWGYN